MHIKQARRLVAEGYLKDVVDLLESLGSSQDPIMYKGEDTTPESLMYNLGWDTKATDIRISFYASNGKGGITLKRGSTFAQMLCDRANMEQERRREENKQAPKRVVEYRVSWQEWEGIDPCGRSEYTSRRKSFKKLADAKKLFESKAIQHPTLLKKVTTETLERTD